ncbi:methyltransferase [Candidatus Kinetoplastibacterium blastocrithidii TCC012E]|uniref:Release factor glutamine methyltransferase n=1 Tax=Candidatus Kinetoplastidibacterium blastocrithidiae TCC012E TaxID=1208922 RepID=M1LVE3_9PROT|nr:peptide chain release factor N(5)-glutamine methyltransferase [Candidatus Kinetoplastibacterium blastocrithidii]AFZ83426.1 methyltransferase [Candidatus Kinetoplastibacterium blastocrithidii (ex Strigomonas culicis)]AGF49522.1 methyltransferase [Candidatus Kinetoplastibacterium blastocrithidii TCC012E]
MEFSIRNLMRDTSLPNTEILILLEKVLQKPKTWIIANDLNVISNVLFYKYIDLRNRRIDGEPIAYLVGYKEFMNNKFLVNRSVLIPRPETELLVDVAINSLKPSNGCRVLDLGTGCGAIAISIYLMKSNIEVVGSDIDLYALSVAEMNSRKLCANIDLIHSNWFDCFDSKMGKFDIIVSNPPYIHSLDKHLESGDLRFEPRIALTDELDGLSHISNIIYNARNYMNKGAYLWLEHGWDQSSMVKYLLKMAGFSNVNSFLDLSGIVRVTGGSI